MPARQLPPCLGAPRCCRCCVGDVRVSESRARSGCKWMHLSMQACIWRPRCSPLQLIPYLEALRPSAICPQPHIETHKARSGGMQTFRLSRHRALSLHVCVRPLRDNAWDGRYGACPRVNDGQPFVVSCYVPSIRVKCCGRGQRRIRLKLRADASPFVFQHLHAPEMPTDVGRRSQMELRQSDSQFTKEHNKQWKSRPR